MDVLTEYNNSKSKITDIEKYLFNLFEQNDIYKVIPYFGLGFTQITELPNPEYVTVSLHNYKDVSPQFSFECLRSDVLLFKDQNILTGWLSISKETLEKVNTAKMVKFFKSFSVLDHSLISIGIKAHPELSNYGKTDGEIAEIVSKYNSIELENTFKEKNNDC